MAEICDHDKGIHLRPVRLCIEIIPVTTCNVTRYITMRCYACGRKWTETE